MNKIPMENECAYCLRNTSHGGECSREKNNKRCLFFKEDPRGCIRRADLKIPIKLFEDFPPLNTWDSRWTIFGNDTEVKINQIKGISWNKGKGLLYIYVNCSYYINEFSEEYKKEINKPNLKVIK